MSFGLLSRGGSLSLVLPGWGLVNTQNKNTSTDHDSVVPPIADEYTAGDHLSVLNALSSQPSRGLFETCDTVYIYIIYIYICDRKLENSTSSNAFFRYIIMKTRKKNIINVFIIMHF